VTQFREDAANSLSQPRRRLAGGDAVIVERLMSPVIYPAEARFRENFLALARRVSDRHAIAWRYLHLGALWRALSKAQDSGRVVKQPKRPLNGRLPWKQRPQP
jgi:hypothetical protein